jgi:hypothetical protein
MGDSYRLLTEVDYNKIAQQAHVPEAQNCHTAEQVLT